MCMPYQKSATPQRINIRGKHQAKKHINFNREALEHGDKDFIDERTIQEYVPKEKKGFFEKLFS